ncbi:hypothetical protein ABZ135_33195 [Streptomyces sp. NPDC006339]|uniref:hypothetical protein n=1 Tax=Streptomyces sp. NPDC006339 TaxID=3156755 RepID=UPI0033B92BF3
MSSTEIRPEVRPRRRGPLFVASVAAGVVLVSGGGVYYAATASDGSGEAVREAPAARDAARGGDGPGIAPGEPDPGGGDGTVYQAKGPLPQGPSSAAVHRPEGRVTSAEVARLGQALGVPGTPRLVGEVWQLAPEKDGSGLRLDVSAKAPGSWSLSRQDGGPIGDTCLKGKACPPPGEAKPPAGGGSPVSEAAAKAAVAPVLKAIGQDDAKLDARQVMNGSVRVVNADPVVGGLPTYGWSTGLHVGPDGSVVAGSGRLKEPVKSAPQPVIGARQALDALNADAKGSGSVGIGGCATAPPADVMSESAGLPQAPCESSGEAASPKVVEVTGAVFGLAAQDVKGEQALVPAWLFQAREKPGAKPFTVVRSAVAQESPAPPEESKEPVRRIDSYRTETDGRKLSVTFWGGVCSTYTVTAQETPEKVLVRVDEKPTEPGRACIMVAVEVTKTVTLQEPLGDRRVVDRASGQAVPRK